MDSEFLKRQLVELPGRHRTAFAAACCERLLPNYSAFAREAGWGEPATLRAAVDYIWSRLDDGDDSVDRGEIERFILRCDAARPDVEVFEIGLVSAARDAGTAVLRALCSLLDADVRNIVEVAACCRSTVHRYIRNRDKLDRDDPSSESRIAQDPLMTREVARQSAILSELAFHPVLDSELLKRLRDELADRGQSNIGLTA